LKKFFRCTILLNDFLGLGVMNNEQ
jgi:hypothetical protein